LDSDESFERGVQPSIVADERRVCMYTSQPIVFISVSISLVYSSLKDMYVCIVHTSGRDKGIPKQPVTVCQCSQSFQLFPLSAYKVRLDPIPETR
jgi:hypothetical protein